MDKPLELIITVYTEREAAGKMLDHVKTLTKNDTFNLVDAAVLEKDEKGHVHIDDKQDVGAGEGALFGAITGGLLGLVAGPGGAVVGAMAGAATGGVTAALVDMGFSEDRLKDLEASMPANSSALVVLIEHAWADRLVSELERNRGRLYRQEVDPFAVNRYSGPEPERR